MSRTSKLMLLLAACVVIYDVALIVELKTREDNAHMYEQKGK